MVLFPLSDEIFQSSCLLSMGRVNVGGRQSRNEAKTSAICRDDEDGMVNFTNFQEFAACSRFHCQLSFLILVVNIFRKQENDD